MINDIIFKIIKTLIEQGNYRMLYEDDSNPYAGWKTRDYIKSLNLPEREVVKRVVDTLTGDKCYSVDIDDNTKFAIQNPGNVFKFKTRCFDDVLYVKVKLLEDPQYFVLIFSIHPAEY